MQEQELRGTAHLLRRARRRRQLRLGLASAAIAFALFVLLAMHLRATRNRAFNCATAVGVAIDGFTAVICQAEYAQTFEPKSGIRLAHALRRAGQLSEAEAFAKGLLVTSAKADALQVLGKIYLEQRRFDDAELMLDRSRELHNEQAEWASLADDHQALAELHFRRGRYEDALTSLDDCIAKAKLSGSAGAESYCQVALARVLTRMGLTERARAALGRAKSLVKAEHENAMYYLEAGNVDDELGLHRTATVSFERSIEHATRALWPALALSAELNLVYSYAEAGEPDQAANHLERARALDADSRYVRECRQLEARIAYGRGDRKHAWELNEVAYHETSSHDDRLDIATMQARIALEDGELAKAIEWARRGVDDLEQLRSSQDGARFPSRVLTARREPYELLFVAQVASKLLEDAIMTFDQWQGRAVVDAMAHPGSLQSASLVRISSRARQLSALLPEVTRGQQVVDGARGAARETLRSIDLLGFTVANGDLWRIAASSGQYSIENLGRFQALEPRVSEFTAKPHDVALANEVGSLLLRGAAFHGTRQALHVLLDGYLAQLPVAALRRDGGPLIAERPIVYVYRIPSASCTPQARPRGATVIADVLGDLPHARLEASRVAEQLKVDPIVGREATSADVLSADREQVLHIAVHAQISEGGAALQLRDEAVSALEISAHSKGPSLVVLSACASALSSDPELQGALPIAFLAAGSKHVIATLGKVGDRDAAAITSQLYQHDALVDPVRALAQIQRERAQTGNREWPKFVVYGLDVCPPEP